MSNDPPPKLVSALVQIEMAKIMASTEARVNNGQSKMLGIREPCISSLHTCTAADIMASNVSVAWGFMYPQ